MQWATTTFVYDHAFREYMKVKGVTLEDVFNYLFDIGAGKF